MNIWNFNSSYKFLSYKLLLLRTVNWNSKPSSKMSWSKNTWSASQDLILTNKGGLGGNVGVTETGKRDHVILEFTKERNKVLDISRHTFQTDLKKWLQKVPERICICQQPETQRKNASWRSTILSNEILTIDSNNSNKRWGQAWASRETCMAV